MHTLAAAAEDDSAVDMVAIHEFEVRSPHSGIRWLVIFTSELPLSHGPYRTRRNRLIGKLSTLNSWSGTPSLWDVSNASSLVAVARH